MALFDWTRKTSSKDHWKLSKWSGVGPKVNPNRSKRPSSEFLGNADSGSQVADQNWANDTIQ